MKRRITRSIVPNLLTLANLFSGFAAIVYASQGEFYKAAVFILLGACFDMLDGLVARLINAASEFGVELDSLCDAVTFGVAPSFLIYEIYFKDFGELGLFFASLPALAGVVRLARFNVQLSSLEDKKYFTGLPIPAGAMTIISYTMFFHFSDMIDESTKSTIMYSLSILVSLIMVSNIKYPNMPRPSLKNIKASPLLYSVIAICAVILIVSKGQAFFPLMVLYILVNGFKHIFLWIKKIREPEDDIDEGGDNLSNTAPPFNL